MSFFTKIPTINHIEPEKPKIANVKCIQALICTECTHLWFIALKVTHTFTFVKVKWYDGIRFYNIQAFTVIKCVLNHLATVVNLVQLNRKRNTLRVNPLGKLNRSLIKRLSQGLLIANVLCLPKCASSAIPCKLKHFVITNSIKTLE